MAASFAHPESFQPLPEYSIRDDACVASSPSLGGVEDIWVRYWDEGSTIAMLEFKVEQPLQQAPEQPTKEKKKKTKGTRVAFILLHMSSRGDYLQSTSNLTNPLKLPPFRYPTNRSL